MKQNKILIVILISLIILVIGLGVTLVLVLNKKEDSSKLNVKKLKKSVVQIEVYDEDYEQIAVGSGVVAFEDDLILTNAHVIEGNESIKVIGEDNEEYFVKGIVAYNRKKDIAILRLSDRNKLKALEISENISVGDDVTAIGSPLGLKNVVSDGIMSGYYKDGTKVYQHTAPISPGSSGGALFNSEGKLVGITYATLEEGQNLNFAIPINEYEDEYDIVKYNRVIDTNDYKYLNNDILKTYEGNTLLKYILGDKYGNEKFKSGVEEIDDKGYFDSSLSIGKSLYVFEDNYKKISKYVSSSVYLSSGVPGCMGTVNSDGELDMSTATEGEGYTIVILELKDNSDIAIKKVKEFFKKEFEGTKIKYNKKYVYGVSYDNYKEQKEVEEIMEGFK